LLTLVATLYACQTLDDLVGAVATLH